MFKYSPIVLFVYSRYDHTKATIEALKNNKLASESELFIFSDGFRNEQDKPGVLAVRSLIENISGFKKVTVIERSSNHGLAKNIQLGVTDIIKNSGRVIVMEDDIVTSPHFLLFMNENLVRYKDIDRVWHISGWNYPIETEGLPGSFLWRGMNCWGWGTWENRWDKFEKNPQRLVSQWSVDDISRFNLDNSYPFWKQVIANNSGKINTWAIFWYATIFENKGLCLNVSQSLVDNIGLDGSGENCSSSSNFYRTEVTTAKYRHGQTIPLVENVAALGKIKKYCINNKPSFISRVINRSKKIIRKLK
ncbi:hypothetical protein AB4615_11860 [Vibrio splendidus]